MTLVQCFRVWVAFSSNTKIIIKETRTISNSIKRYWYHPGYHIILTCNHNKKTKHAKISENENFWYHLIHTCTFAYQGVRNFGFSGNLTCYIFLLPPSWYLPFCLITDKLCAWIWWKIVKLAIFRCYNTIFHYKRSSLHELEVSNIDVYLF